MRTLDEWYPEDSGVRRVPGYGGQFLGAEKAAF
jgi:hypothetical protein